MSNSRSQRAGTDGWAYSPFDTAEDRRLWPAELSCLALAAGGMCLHDLELGLVAGAALLLLWTRLRVEFVFAAGVMLLAGIGGTVAALGGVLTVTGLAGVLAVDLTRTWRSVGPAVLFVVLAAGAGTGVVYASAELVPHWLAVVVVAGASLLSYALHRYEVVRLGRAEETVGAPDDGTDDDEETSTDRRPADGRPPSAGAGERDPRDDRRSDST